MVILALVCIPTEDGWERVKIAFGRTKEGLKIKADVSRKVASVLGVASALTAKSQSIQGQFLSKLFGWMSTLSTADAHLLDIERGEFRQEGLIVDTITIATDYCKNPIIEVFYDEAFTSSAPYIFDYKEKQQ